MKKYTFLGKKAENPKNQVINYQQFKILDFSYCKLITGGFFFYIFLGT